MNRPPKKHKTSKDGLLRDPRFDQDALEHAKGAKSATAGDDRNLVSIDDAMGEADFSDRLWLFWQRNRSVISIAVAAVIVVVAGYFAVQFLKLHFHGSMQREYVAAQQSPAELEAFAASNSSKPLGGVAYIQLADEAYDAGEFAKAADLYAKSQAGLASTPAFGRALLGQGISLQFAGQTDEARKVLGQLVENTQVLGALRAQAAFDLIVLEISQNQNDAAKAWLKRVTEIPGAGIWAEQAVGYATQHGVTL